MKTTIQIADALLAEAKTVAANEHTTLRSLVEEGLRLALDRRAGRAEFELRDASVDGEGLAPEFRGAGWERLREAMYEPIGS